MLPKSLRVTFRLSDSALAMPKSRTLTLSAAEHPDVARLQVAVQQRTKVASVDRRLEAVRRFEEMAQLNRDVDGAVRRQRAGRENLGEIPAVEVLHRDVEVAALGAVLVHDRHVLADPAELLLKLRAPALGLEHFLRVAIGAGRNQLERDTLPSRLSVARKTTAMPPRPISWTISYGPTRTRWKTRRHHRPRPDRAASSTTSSERPARRRTSCRGSNHCARAVARIAEGVAADVVEDVAGEERIGAFVDDERSADALGRAVSHEHIVSDAAADADADGQRGAGIVVDVAGQDRGNRHAIDDDRGVRCAGDLDVH